MKQRAIHRSYKPAASALLMLLALLWLTVSTPFVYACQQQVAAAQKEGTQKAGISNPLAGTNEEKPESGTSNLSEYLHEIVLSGHLTQPLVKYEKCHSSNLYLAFHPELLCPPPNTVG